MQNLRIKSSELLKRLRSIEEREGPPIQAGEVLQDTEDSLYEVTRNGLFITRSRLVIELFPGSCKTPGSARWCFGFLKKPVSCQFLLEEGPFVLKLNVQRHIVVLGLSKNGCSIHFDLNTRASVKLRQ